MVSLEEIQKEANEAMMQCVNQFRVESAEVDTHFAPRKVTCPTCGKWGLLEGTWANDIPSSRCAGCVKDPTFCSCR